MGICAKIANLLLKHFKSFGKNQKKKKKKKRGLIEANDFLLN